MRIHKYTHKFVPLAAMLLIALLFTTILAVVDATYDWTYLNRVFLGMLFLTFGVSKAVRLGDFVQGYRTYDLGAMVAPAYAAVVPLIEILLGIAYLTDINPLWTNGVALFFVTFGAMGVLASLVGRRRQRSMRMGTMVDMPLSWITVVEDMLVAGLVAATLWYM